MAINQNPPLLQFPSLRFISGLRKGERIPVRSASWIIGRDPTAGLQLDSPYVSRQHAELVRQGGYWFLVDLYSKNGVIKNRVRIQPGERVSLNHHDVVQIGSVSSFEFLDPEDTLHESQIGMRTPGVWLDVPNREVYLADQPLDPPLSRQQFGVLNLLVRNQGSVVSNETIAALLWPEAAGGVESAAIDNVISRLRRRLAELDESHAYIETVRGIGRRFVQRANEKGPASHPQ